MFYWDDSLLTGIDEIDKEHIELCKRANDLFEAFLKGNILEEINASMGYFEEYIYEHLKNEEIIQQKSNFPDYKIHKLKHDAFRKNFEELKQLVKTKGVTYNFAQKFNGTIVEWLAFHLREDDIVLSKYIKALDAPTIKELNISIKNK